MYQFTPFDPGDIIASGVELLAEAQMVVAMRLAGMLGFWPVQPDEPQRMIGEKLPALMGAASDAQSAALSGCRPDEIAIAAITPLTGAARANRLRLSAPSGRNST